MAVVNISKANLKIFKPVVTSRHSLSYKWLIESGYSVAYLCLCLNIRVELLSGYFREPNKFTVHHIQVIILLLKGIKEPNEVIKSLLIPIDETNTKTNEDLKTLYNEIALPVPTRSVPMHRLDYEPKKTKDND